MRSNDREEIAVAFKALATAVDAVLELDFDALTTPERFAYLKQCEQARRRLPAVEHPLINGLRRQASPAELSGRLHWAIADRLLIARAEAKRRVDAAAELGPRQTLTGEPLEPVRPATAAGQRAGLLGDGDVRAIRDFFDQLPEGVHPEAAQIAEARLAEFAEDHRPEEVRQLAGALFDHLVPDGLFSDVTRAKRRKLTIGPQDADGMSSISGWLDPEARAALDAVLAKLAAPGMCNPDDEVPCVSGTPGKEAIQADTRGASQRNHDALKALCRAALASGDLGRHNGLPVAIIVSAGLAELESGTGKAHTGGGTWLPMSDVIRMASHAHHYLRIFDGAKELALFHTRRIASAAQRIVLHARDRGCSHANCPVPGYLCEAHHVYDYAQNPETDVHDLTWRCGSHHEIIGPDGWTTRRRHDGTIETIPPAHADHGQARTNSYHHPERLLCRESRGNDDDDEDDDEDEDWA